MEGFPVYRQLIYPVLQSVDPERTHELVLRLLQGFERAPLLRKLLGKLFVVDDPRLGVEVWGMHFANPLGIAAGLDKNGVAVETWGALGFGHVEVGTVTPRPQPGNPRPRLYRLPADQALINRLGFPGHGAVAVHDQLQRHAGSRLVVGVNIGANKASVEAGRANEDYVRALEQLYAVADYITINISSPNTLRLRDLQGCVALEALVQQVVARRDTMSVRKPILVKIAPDLAPAELDDILHVSTAHAIDGLIATNTTVARPPTLRSRYRRESGGLSGVPLRERATDILRYVYGSTGGALPIIAVGGVFDAADVFARLAAGAALVQVYTGFVYGGPGLARRLLRGVLRLMDAQGLTSIAEIRGLSCGASSSALV